MYGVFADADQSRQIQRGQSKRNRQTENDKHEDVEDGKNLCDSLRERPAGNNVSYRNFINIAPLNA